MHNNTKILIIVVSIIFLLMAYFLFFRKKTRNNQSIQPIITPNNIVTGAENIIKTNDGFPLGVGSSGQNVRYLQQALNWIRPANNLIIDGDFGSATRIALLLSVNTSLSQLPMDEKQFNNIIQLGNQSKQK